MTPKNVLYDEQNGAVTTSTMSFQNSSYAWLHQILRTLYVARFFLIKVAQKQTLLGSYQVASDNNIFQIRQKRFVNKFSSRIIPFSNWLDQFQHGCEIQDINMSISITMRIV